MTILHRLGVNLSKLATEVHTLDAKLRPVQDQAEIKLFFLYRHFTPLPLEVNQYVLGRWEPRVVKLERNLTMDQYEKLRKFLGMSDVKTGTFTLPDRDEPSEPCDEDDTED